MEFARIVKRYMKGDDVKAVKDKLVELGLLQGQSPILCKLESRVR